MFSWLLGAGGMAAVLLLRAGWLGTRIIKLDRAGGQSLTGADPALTARSLSIAKQYRLFLWSGIGAAVLTVIVFVLMVLREQHLF